MKFSIVVEHLLDLLQRQGRVSYRMLKREFDLNDEVLADLKEELRYSHVQQVREEGPGLVWVGEQPVISSQSSVVSPQPPITYTPAHLAERIRAEQAALEARGMADGERKTITALFADLKGSTALIEGLDPEEARQMLAAVYQWFTEGFDTKDWQEAQALLAELGDNEIVAVSLEDERGRT